MQKTVENFLRKKPGYLKKSFNTIAYKCGFEMNSRTIEVIRKAIATIKEENKPKIDNFSDSPFIGFSFIEKKSQEAINESEIREFKEKVNKILEKDQKKTTYSYTAKIQEVQGETVLVIGDIHEPFCKDGYLEFCIETYKKYKCTRVVFIGDIIDNHYSSFHNSDPDGFSAGEELERALYKISKWVKAFPVANVIIGNHDRLAHRKAFASGVSKRWIRDYNDVLGAPGWVFLEKVVIDGVEYSHGETGTARSKSKDTGRSRVQGHLHSQAYIEWINNRTFAVQVGTGVDDAKYAFAYNKDGKESILSCAVIEYGKQPHLIKM